MKGNPHAESVNNGIQNVRDLIGKRELYQRDGLGLIVEAQSRMAIAHETRTATLVTMLAFVPMEDDVYAELRQDVMDRLGQR